MIGRFSARVRIFTVALEWNKPVYLPYHYLLSCTCKHMGCEGTYECLPRSFGRNVTKGFVSHIYPGSYCEIKLLAVYNPASNDPGIRRSIPIPPISEKYSAVFNESYCVL